MEYPIPNNLYGYISITDNDSDEYKVTGKIKCKCGCSDFRVFESNDKMITNLLCLSCNEKITLFDEGKNGWNGFVCNDDNLDREEILHEVKCNKCGSDVFKIQVSINSQGKEDFIEESNLENSMGQSLKEEDWVNAFEWFNANITCVNCNDKQVDWIDCETM